MKKASALILTFLLLFLIEVQAYGSVGEVEIFDITKEKVVKTLESKPLIKNEALSYLENITGMYQKFSPIPQKGFAVKVPFVPPVYVSNQWLTTAVNSIVILFPEREEPFLIVFQEDSAPSCFTFNSDTKKLLESIDYMTEL